MAFVPPGTPPPTSTPSELNEGLALFITFAILILLSTWSVTAKFALWVAIALTALVWTNAARSGQLKTFWQALSQ